RDTCCSGAFAVCLLSVDHLAKGGSIPLPAERTAPKQFSCASIQRIKVSLASAAEQKVGRRGQHPCISDVVHLEFPLLVAGLHVERTDEPVTFCFGSFVWGPKLRRARRYVADSSRPAALDRDAARVLPARNIEELGVGTVRWRIPIRPTVYCGHDQRPFLRWHHAGYSLRPALVVEAVHPVH